MTYGLVSYNNYSGNIRNISQDMLGGRVFVKFIDQAWVSGGVHDYAISGVSDNTALKIYTLDPGSHSISTFVSGGLAYVRLTALGATRAKGTKLLVFTTKTDEPEYGLLTVNDSGERLVSTLYPCPQFLQKLTYGSAVGGGAYSVSRTTNIHYSNEYITGSGQLKIVLYTIPESNNDCWYILDSFIGTGSGMQDTLQVDAADNVAYNLPEGFVFALDNLTTGSDTYGLRIYGPSNPTSLLTFDSGNYYANIKGYETLEYSSGSATAITSNVFTGNLPAFLIPQYSQEIVTQTRSGYQSFYFSTYRGCVKRVGNTLYTQRRLTEQYWDDGGSPGTTYTYGSSTNLCFAIDAYILGGAPNPPFVGAIASTGGSTSCTYSVDSASSCNTTQYFSASISGGTGAQVVYTWSVSGSGFSISGDTNLSYCTVVNNAGSGSYTGTLYCTMVQSGVTITATYSLSHVHSTTALTGSVSVTNQTSSCSAALGSCTTSETHVANTSGGNGNTKYYTWEFITNPGGFSFTTGTSGSSVTLSRTAGAGTYTCTTRCTITQSGSATLIFDTNVSHTHDAASYTVVNPLGFNGKTYGTGNYDVSSQTMLTILRNGTWIVEDYSVVYETGNWVNPTSSTIGDSYWVKFTLTSTSGSYGSYSGSTDWVQLNSDQNVAVAVSNTGTSLRTRSATYNVQISNSYNGTVLGSGTITLTAQASSQ